MEKIGVCVDNLGPSQLSYSFVNNANKLLSKRSDISVYGFFENTTRPIMMPAFGIFNMTEVYGFDGILITTNAMLTHQNMKFPRPKKRIYYVNQIEWGNQSFEFYLDVFKNVEVWARSEDYAKLVENCFNVPCKVNENFELEMFI